MGLEVVYGSVEPLLAEDATANKGKLKLSINDFRNPNIVSKMAVFLAPRAFSVLKVSACWTIARLGLWLTRVSPWKHHSLRINIRIRLFDANRVEKKKLWFTAEQCFEN
jgi:hypothetical protein